MQRRLTFSVFLSLFLSYQINAQESCSNLEKIITFNHAEIGAISIHKDSANTTQASVLVLTVNGNRIVSQISIKLKLKILLVQQRFVFLLW